jgi:hypothetical protein
MGEKSTPSVSPEYTPIASSDQSAAQQYLTTGNQQLATAKNLATGQETTANQAASGDQTAASTDFQNQAQSQAQYQGTYVPIENQFASQATTYANADNQNQQAGAAEANVATQFDAARSNAQASLESYGVDPSQTRFGALDLGTQVQQAAATAAAGTTSRLQTQMTGMQLENQAISTGLNVNSQGLQAGAQGVNAGTAATSAKNTTASTVMNNEGTAPTYAGLGLNANSQAVNALNTGFENQYQSDQLGYQEGQSTINDIGGLVGVGLGAYEGGMFGGGATTTTDLPSTAIPTDTSGLTMPAPQYIPAYAGVQA